MTTIHTAATQLDVTDDTIVVLVDQISDDPDLWDEETQQITATGMELIRDQLAADDPIGDDLMATVEHTARRFEAASAVTEAARLARNDAIRAAVAHGEKRTAVARAAGICRERLYQII